ncbi:MAG TPA: GGDEF domain-containing protein [Cyanobacteria bacterium UBA11049]|nr:GGDEF domain-containing protein [Cyanobacteria bacterium UBA11049]
MPILRLKQNSLRNRFIFSMGAMLLPLVVLGVSAFVSLESAIGGFAKTEDKTLEELFPLTNLESLIVKASIPAENYLSHGDPQQRDRFVRLCQEVDKNFAAILDRPSNLQEKQVLLLAAQKAWQQAKNSSEVIFTYSYPATNPSVTQEKKRLDTYTRQAIDNLEQLYKLLIHLQIADNIAHAQDVMHRQQLIITTVFALGLGVAAVASLVLARSIMLPLRILKEGAERLGEGELSHRIDLATQDELGQLAMTFNSMAQKLEQSQTELKNLASMDGLTGVYNRREFNQQLQAELERSQRYNHPCSLVMLDIDYFKKLNDTHGHQAGDEALRVVAALVKNSVRPVDRVARYGGEEFGIILPETPGDSGLVAAERLRQAIATHLVPITSEQSINITVSVGVATFPSDANSPEALIAAADRALYAAKHSGRNRVVSSNSLSLIEQAS